MRPVPVVLFLFFCAFPGYGKEDCTLNKREDRCASIFEDKQNCLNVEYRPMLMDCLVTCSSCDSFSCSNPQPDSALNCSALASQCNSTTWGQFMKEKCPATCGKCDVKNANMCNDQEDSIVCSSMEKFCNSVEYYDQMTKQCPSTCNRCPNNGTEPTGICQDLADNCQANVDKCTHPKYSSLMHRICRKTCNTCGAVICEDETSSCIQWNQRGFCSNPGYDTSHKKKYCSKTCNLCNT